MASPRLGISFRKKNVLKNGRQLRESKGNLRTWNLRAIMRLRALLKSKAGTQIKTRVPPACKAERETCTCPFFVLVIMTGADRRVPAAGRSLQSPPLTRLSTDEEGSAGELLSDELRPRRLVGSALSQDGKPRLNFFSL